ncbi:ORF45-like protein [Bufonid herpesvirus 1]|uniref:ORF45-like protein n=1 Tax=Bufonid herpesvirus 1 TaxID=2282206 RepID=UPI000EB66B56|nr:ORF45-like protein [Bufonid herpesvirus 1]AXF48604.1 ORF45-like protein [Bufonid herpesvirus 1]
MASSSSSNAFATGFCLFLILACTRFAGALFFINRCAVISSWWTHDGTLVPQEDLVVGHTYTVYLSFSTEGVSVALQQNSNLCSYWCPGEVLLRLTYPGYNRICRFVSTDSAEALNRYCVYCNHYCDHRRNRLYNDSSVDACLETSPLSPLVQFWSAAMLNKTLTMDVAEWVLKQKQKTASCLYQLSGVVFPPTISQECARRLAPACFANGTMCLKKERGVICRIKAWSIETYDANTLASCDICVIDYFRIDEHAITYYNRRGNTIFQAVQKACPGPVHVGWGGVTFTKESVAAMGSEAFVAKEMVAATKGSGFSGMHLESWQMTSSLIDHIYGLATRHGLSVVIRTKRTDNLVYPTQHVFMYDNATSASNLDTLLRSVALKLKPSKIFIKVPVEHEVLYRKPF